MAKPASPLVVEFNDLSAEHLTALDGHPARVSAPIQSREDPRRWIIAFRPDLESSAELFDSIRRWARRMGISTPRRRT